MFVFTPVSLHNIFSVGIFPFILSFLATMTKIFLQAIRFYYFIRKFIGNNVKQYYWKMTFARLAGEFVTQTTPSYIGGEISEDCFFDQK